MFSGAKYGDLKNERNRNPISFKRLLILCHFRNNALTHMPAFPEFRFFSGLT